MTLVATDLLEGVASRLDLREPNKSAVESLAAEMAQWFEADERPPPFEGIIDAATGVGKTYILAAAIEYFAALGTRNFAVITPGRTILEKTEANFTNGHPKSLLGGMEVEPVVITSDNFATAAMRAAMDDPEQVKLFIFTVQSLTKPTTEMGRKTHKFQEGLGKAFYDHLDAQDDLIVFADEHHCYYGDKFSEAVRDLTPRALVGLTATPHKKTPPEEIIYRYPLAAAIADQLVKTPVLVGRKDDRSDPTTKLLDGVRLLDAKEQTVARYCQETGDKPVRPVMLVIAQSIEDSEDYAALLRDDSFAGGRFKDAVLVVHSKKPDEDLKKLDSVEDDDSPVRIIVSVGMLKEGWDVKNVYVIASMRSSVSDILTEQTLGRGLRLPFGAYTGWELLDTLEVLAHERYEGLLRKARIINEAFIDHRTRAVIRKNAEGQEVATVENEPVAVGVSSNGEPEAGATGQPVIASTDERYKQAEAQLQAKELKPRRGLPEIKLPELKMTTVESNFSLADITDNRPFRELGERIGANPVEELRRIRLSAHVVRTPDGFRQTELTPGKAIDRIESPGSLIPLEDARQALTDAVLAAPVVPARKEERRAVAPKIEAFLDGLGTEAEQILSGYADRAVAGLIELINKEHRRFVTAPKYAEVVSIKDFAPTRTGKLQTSQERIGAVKKSTGYEGWSKSLYEQVWFDSSTERDLANILDDADEIAVWVRLHIKDLPIRWENGNYNPDFVAVEAGGTNWLIEVKADNEVASADVRSKADAAQRWANHVSAKVEVSWNYLFVSETAIERAHGDWTALKRGAGF